MVTPGLLKFLSFSLYLYLSISIPSFLHIVGCPYFSGSEDLRPPFDAFSVREAFNNIRGEVFPVCQHMHVRVYVMCSREKI